MASAGQEESHARDGAGGRLGRRILGGILFRQAIVWARHAFILPILYSAGKGDSSSERST